VNYFEQFLLIAVVHFFAVASPGPDFAIIVKQSIRYNRKVAIYTSLGIAAGIMLHVTYSIVGIGLLIASDERLFIGLKYIAAAYFCYVAWHGLRAKKTTKSDSIKTGIEPTELKGVGISSQHSKQDHQTSLKAFLTGFLINGLNVKATLFFVSLFSLVIPHDTALAMKLSYGLYMVFATASWFILLSYLLTHQKVSEVLNRYGYLLDRVMGAILLLLAIHLIFFD
jgi:threonine/homoserine/homoserine lactone efflux protein